MTDAIEDLSDRDGASEDERVREAVRGALRQALDLPRHAAADRRGADHAAGRRVLAAFEPEEETVP